MKSEQQEILKGVTPNGTPFSLYPPNHGCSSYQLRFTDPRSHKQLRISSKGVKQVRLALMAWAAQQVEGFVPGSTTGKVTVADLVLAVLKHKRNHQPRDYQEKLGNWERRLRDKFGDWDSRDLTAADIEDYKTWCSGAALDGSASRLLRSWAPIAKAVKPATVNLDLALLSKAYNDGMRTRLITIKPYIAKYTDKNLKPFVRQGFLDQSEYDRIMQLSLPLWLRAMICMAFTCGNRSAELKGLQVRQVNFLARNVRLYAGETKNGEGRLLGMTQEMYLLLEAACEGKGPDDFVFAREGGRQVGDIRKLWAGVLKQAGIERHITLHDFRRSAVRNGLNRGLTEQEVMAMGGWKTRAMLDRYNVRREGELQATMAKIEAGAKLERQLIAEQNCLRPSQILVSSAKPEVIN